MFNLFKKYLITETYEDVTNEFGVQRVVTNVTLHKGKKIMRTWEKRIAAGECIEQVALIRQKDCFVLEIISTYKES